jgi:hypothetical protein
MQHIVGRRNIGLIFNRQIVGNSISHFGVSRIPICHGTFYLGNKGQDYFAPISIFDDDLQSSRKLGRSNFTLEITAALNEIARTGNLAPESIFHYIYAVFHSPTYRTRYAEFLKIDFPRLPLPGSLPLFTSLAKLGGELVALHLLESPRVDDFITDYTDQRAPEIEKVTYTDGTVWIDKAQTIGFAGVPEAVWNFHVGGYQVCEKWLKDRKGRKLLAEDVRHYQRVVVALSETICIMKEIDLVIEKYGGWPKAFALSGAKEPTVAGEEAQEAYGEEAAEEEPGYGAEMVPTLTGVKRGAKKSKVGREGELFGGEP